MQFVCLLNLSIFVSNCHRLACKFPMAGRSSFLIWIPTNQKPTKKKYANLNNVVVVVVFVAIGHSMVDVSSRAKERVSTSHERKIKIAYPIVTLESKRRTKKKTLSRALSVCNLIIVLLLVNVYAAHPPTIYLNISMMETSPATSASERRV